MNVYLESVTCTAEDDCSFELLMQLRRAEIG